MNRAEYLTGAIDLYVHAAPDLLPRQYDDIALARLASEAGLRAILHRNHFAGTMDRGALASAHGGTEVAGALLLNEHVGGLNPAVVDVALRSGARWIGMPTLSARNFRSRLIDLTGYGEILALGEGRLELVDTDGALIPAVHEIIGMVAARRAALGLGYGTFDECVALVIAARDAGVQALVLTYPDIMGLEDAQIFALLEYPGVMLEICAFTLHPRGPSSSAAAALQRRALGWLDKLGAARCIASSDGGMSGFPNPIELMRWLICWLAENGVAASDIDMLVRRNPAKVLGIDEA